MIYGNPVVAVNHKAEFHPEVTQGDRRILKQKVSMAMHRIEIRKFIDFDNLKYLSPEKHA